MALIDPYGRSIEYLRLSVTDRCDLRCIYCLPPGFRDFLKPAEWLDFDGIERVVGAFARLGMYRRVQVLHKVDNGPFKTSNGDIGGA